MGREPTVCFNWRAAQKHVAGSGQSGVELLRAKSGHAAASEAMCMT